MLQNPEGEPSNNFQEETHDADTKLTTSDANTANANSQESRPTKRQRGEVCDRNYFSCYLYLFLP